MQYLPTGRHVEAPRTPTIPKAKLVVLGEIVSPLRSETRNRHPNPRNICCISNVCCRKRHPVAVEHVAAPVGKTASTYIASFRSPLFSALYLLNYFFFAVLIHTLVHANLLYWKELLGRGKGRSECTSTCRSTRVAFAVSPSRYPRKVANGTEPAYMSTIWTIF